MLFILLTYCNLIVSLFLSTVLKDYSQNKQVTLLLFLLKGLKPVSLLIWEAQGEKPELPWVSYPKSHHNNIEKLSNCPGIGVPPGENCQYNIADKDNPSIQWFIGEIEVYYHWTKDIVIRSFLSSGEKKEGAAFSNFLVIKFLN